MARNFIDDVAAKIAASGATGAAVQIDVTPKEENMNKQELMEEATAQRKPAEVVAPSLKPEEGMEVGETYMDLYLPASPAKTNGTYFNLHGGAVLKGRSDANTGNYVGSPWMRFWLCPPTYKKVKHTINGDPCTDESEEGVVLQSVLAFDDQGRVKRSKVKAEFVELDTPQTPNLDEVGDPTMKMIILSYLKGDEKMRQLVDATLGDSPILETIKKFANTSPVVKRWDVPHDKYLMKRFGAYLVQFIANFPSQTRKKFEKWANVINQRGGDDRYHFFLRIKITGGAFMAARDNAKLETFVGTDLEPYKYEDGNPVQYMPMGVEVVAMELRTGSVRVKDTTLYLDPSGDKAAVEACRDVVESNKVQYYSQELLEARAAKVNPWITAIKETSGKKKLQKLGITGDDSQIYTLGKAAAEGGEAEQKAYQSLLDELRDAVKEAGDSDLTPERLEGIINATEKRIEEETTTGKPKKAPTSKKRPRSKTKNVEAPAVEAPAVENTPEPEGEVINFSDLDDLLGDIIA